MGTAASLDHIGIAGADLGAMAAAFERLGFQLTPPARHSGRRTPEAPIEPFGTGNRCIMLEEGYLELIAVIDPSAFDNLVGNALRRYAGIHIVALGINDEEANLQRLRQAGVPIPGIAYLERPVDDAVPDGLRARFARLPLPDAPEGRIMLIRHLTPEAIWQPQFLRHPNRAVALDAVVIAAEQPADAAARFSRLAGRPVEPDPAGGFALKLPRGRIRLLPPERLGSVFPGAPIPTLPFIAGAILRTGDANLAASRIFRDAGVGVEDTAAGLLVPPAEAAGATVLFAPG